MVDGAALEAVVLAEEAAELVPVADAVPDTEVDPDGDPGAGAATLSLGLL